MMGIVIRNAFPTYPNGFPRDVVERFEEIVGAKVLGIVGRDGGYTGSVADAVVIIPTVNSATVTPHSEAFQAVIWHLLVSHPELQANPTKWESVAR